MANVLKMAKIQSIQQLHAAGWSQRRIARELGIDRGAVARYLRPRPPDPKPAIPPTGSDGSNAATFSPLPALAGDATAGSENTDSAAAPNTAILPTGSGSEKLAVATDSPRGRRSQCGSYRELIQAKLDQQLSAQRIWQDLVAEHGFTGCYDSVILDRFLHHAEVIAITGKSYRLRNQSRHDSPAPEAALENSKPANPPTGSPSSGKRKKPTPETTETCPS